MLCLFVSFLGDLIQHLSIKNLHCWAAAVARAFASGPGVWVHGYCHQWDGKTQSKHFLWVHRDSPAPGDHGKILTHPCWVPVWIPVHCHRLPEGQRSSKWVVGLRAVVCFELRSHSPHRQKTRWAHQRKGHYCKACDSLVAPCRKKMTRM